MNAIGFLFFTILLTSMWLFPSATFALGITFLLFNVATAISSIFKKHKPAENPRPKIAKDIFILVVTLLLIIFLGGLAGMFANYYASSHFGGVAGFVAAIIASLVVGYLVKTGVVKIFKWR